MSACTASCEKDSACIIIYIIQLLYHPLISVCPRLSYKKGAGGFSSRESRLKERDLSFILLQRFEYVHYALFDHSESPHPVLFCSKRPLSWLTLSVFLCSQQKRSEE